MSAEQNGWNYSGILSLIAVFQCLSVAAVYSIIDGWYFTNSWHGCSPANGNLHLGKRKHTLGTIFSKGERE